MKLLQISENPTKKPIPPFIIHHASRTKPRNQNPNAQPSRPHQSIHVVPRTTGSAGLASRCARGGVRSGRQVCGADNHLGSRNGTLSAGCGAGGVGWRRHANRTLSSTRTEPPVPAPRSRWHLRWLLVSLGLWGSILLGKPS
jgi:hypothetical protein